MARYRCSACGELFASRNVACPTEGCAGGLDTYAPFDERAARAPGPRRGGGGAAAGPTVRLGAVDASDRVRLRTGVAEFDRVAGGGLVSGSLVLVAGEPGCGKSTLALGVTDALVRGGRSTLYVSGEESAGQIRLRAERLGLDLDALEVLCTDDAETAAATIEAISPDVAVIDSVQTIALPGLGGAPGSPGQVREVAGRLMRAARASGAALVIIGHVTKDNTIAGPRTLEHLVDTVMLLEGDRHGDLRILRAVKNRFGATDELGLFEMRERGLTGIDAAEALADVTGEPFGRALCPVLVGERPLLVEVGALVSKASFGTGRRVAVGVPAQRLATLLAVLERHAGIDLGAHDVYVSTGAGIAVEETAIDAAVLAAVASSYWSVALPEGTAVWGEVSLGGGLRRSRAAGARARESARAGHPRLVAPPAPDAELPAEARLDAMRDVRTLLDRLGVLRPEGATPVPAGRPAASAGWMWGRRGRRDEEGDE